MLIERRVKIGIMSSADGEATEESRAVAFALGRAIGHADCCVVTDGGSSLQLDVARGAKAEGGLVIGISSGPRLDEQMYAHDSSIEAYDLVIVADSGLMGPERAKIRYSDIVVMIGGTFSTLEEVTIAYDAGKLIGVLRGTGGISAITEDILPAGKNDSGARVLYDSDPQQFVTRLLDIYRTFHGREPLCCEDGTDDACSTLPVRNRE